MNAVCAPPFAGSRVAASCASAITSPSALSPACVSARVTSAVIEPITRFASGAEIRAYFSISCVWAPSLATSRVTITFVAVFDVTSPLAESIVSSMSVSTRPNALALVTSFVPIMQLYAWCV